MKSISKALKGPKKIHKKSRTNQEHAIKSKKIHKASKNLQKSLKFTENSHKIKQIHNESKRSEKVREKAIICRNKSPTSYKLP